MDMLAHKNRFVKSFWNICFVLFACVLLRVLFPFIILRDMRIDLFREMCDQGRILLGIQSEDVALTIRGNGESGRILLAFSYIDHLLPF